MSILNQYVNYFPKAVAKAETPDYYGTKRILRDILVKMHTSHEHLHHIAALRALPKEEQSEYKNRMLPCFTVSGYFEKDGKGSRIREDLIYRTGLLCLDLDAKQPGADLKALKRQITNEPFVAYTGDSCRGNGIFAIIHIADPDKHEYYFDFLTRWMEMNGCLSAFDRSTKNINRLRFIAPDSDHYINDNAPSLPLPLIKQKPKSIFQYPSATINGNLFQWCRTQVNKSCSFAEGTRHEYIMHLARYCNLKGLSEHETLNGCMEYVQPGFTEAEIKQIVKHIYTTQSGSHNTYPFTQKVNKPVQGIQRLAAMNQMQTVEILPISAPESLPVQEKHEPEKQEVSTIQPIRDVRSDALLCSENFRQEENSYKSEHDWKNEISELQTYFEGTILPGSVKLNPYSTITDISKFIHSHLAFVKANNGKRTFLPYLTRLQELKQIISNTP